MSHLLQELNKLRSKGKPRVKRDRIRKKNVEAGKQIPVEDLAIPSSSEAEEVWCEFNADPDTGFKPKWRKRNLPDYRPGKVKVYTPEEIEEYENERLP